MTIKVFATVKVYNLNNVRKLHNSAHVQQCCAFRDFSNDAINCHIYDILPKSL